MAINLLKNRDSMLKAWHDVLDTKTLTDWALFGYEGQSNDLKVVGSGSGGIEELAEDLNSGQIMYAFVKVEDPKTTLAKCVLINWQGEGANTVRKGICANHLRDVEKFFHGANITINARNEEEVDSSLIIDKVSKAGSAYSFKAPRGDNAGPTGPIGTTYKRVNPMQEINTSERDQFWLKEEQEEKRRVEEERKRRESERMKLEEEVKKRETAEALRRDEMTKLRNNSIDKIKQAEEKATAFERQHSKEADSMSNSMSCSSIDENNSSTSLGNIVDIRTTNQSDIMRQERNLEAQNLIAQRTIDARAIFERNTSAGQLSSKRAPMKPVRNSIPNTQPVGTSIAQQQKLDENKQETNFTSVPDVVPSYTTPSTITDKTNIVSSQATINNINEVSYNNGSNGNQSDGESDDQFATIKRSPRDGAVTGEKTSVPGSNLTSPIVDQQNSINGLQTKLQQQQEVVVKEDVQQEQYENHHHHPQNEEEPTIQETVQQLTEQQIVDEVVYGDLTDPGIQARALYDYQAADDTEITFDPGDIITHIELVDEGWWQGLGPDGTYGLFPANYVELI